MIKPTVWIQTGIVIIYGSSLDAQPHSHLTIQVVWPTVNSSCHLDGNDISGLCVVDASVEHQLKMQEGWILLIEPKSELGEELSKKLAGLPIKYISSSYSTKIEQFKNPENLSNFLEPLLKELQLAPQSLLSNKSTVIDTRIKKLVDELDLCINANCIKPSNWRASEIALRLALSESRFLHLFREQLGIAWRPYLLWRRMICALQAILNGSSATESAHLAGFSDSAHLSRTFRRSFGMTIRQARALFSKS